jgi:tetratricopeptide (TPR) repeat protein
MCIALAKQPSAAMPLFERALAQNPDHLVALHQLLECSYQVGAFNRAESALRRYLSVKPVDTAIRFCLAGVLYKQGLWAAAGAELTRVIAEKPDHDSAKELQALIAQQMNPTAQKVEPVTASAAVEMSMKEAATESTERSTGIAADYFRSRDEEAASVASWAEGKIEEIEAFKRDGKNAEAKDLLEKVRRTSGLTDAQRERFTCLEAEFLVIEDDLEGADMMYSRILSANPRCSRALCGKGALAAEKQDWTMAKDYFERGLSANPSDDVALAGLGLCAMVSKNEEKAFDLFKQAVITNPENRRALLGVLQLGYPLKKFTEIEKALVSYLELHPANLEMLYSFAGILFAQGKVEQAKSEVEKILIFEPKHPRALELQSLIRGEKPGQSVVM